MGETPAELLEMSDRKDGGVDGNKGKPDTAGRCGGRNPPKWCDQGKENTEHGVLDELRDGGSRGKVWIKI